MEAAQEMANSIGQIDTLYQKSGEEINVLLKEAQAHPFVINEVNRILNISISTSRNLMQPAMDVIFF